MGLNTIKIAYRLALGFGLMLILMAGITVIADHTTRQAREHLNEAVNLSNSKSAVAAAMRQALIRQSQIARNIGMSDDIDEMQKEMAQIAVEQKIYRDNETQLIGFGLNHDEQAIIAEMQEHGKAIAPFMQQAEELVGAFNAGQAVKILGTQAAPIQEKWLQAIDRLVDRQISQIRTNLAQFEAASDRATLLMVTICVTSMLLAIAIGGLLTRSITGSVGQLITFSKRVASGNLSARADQSGAHEFAILARAMNQMAQSLEDSQTQLLAAARQAGMAEIATNVLHNIGNVLNSVNVSVELITSSVRASKAQGLSRAVQLMDEHAADLGEFLTRDARGRLLPAYLGQLALALAAEQQAMVEELGHLGKSIDHIKDVVATQQSYAGSASIVEPLQIRDLADDALRMSGEALARHQVTVVKEFAPVPVLPLDRAQVLLILVNLISNAKYAMESMAPGARQITLQVQAAGGLLRISVADKGEGIPADNLTRIFAHGFTTRKAGHGFGLHSCALAARQMGGALTAHSDGPGRGATFTLELPIGTAQGAS